MKFNECMKCSTEFLFSRAVCPECGSEDIATTDVKNGKAVEVVHLIATPAPFPDEYSVVLFQTPNGTRGFCRTTAPISKGQDIEITGDEYGPLCNPRN